MSQGWGNQGNRQPQGWGQPPQQPGWGQQGWGNQPQQPQGWGQQGGQQGWGQQGGQQGWGQQGPQKPVPGGWGNQGGSNQGFSNHPGKHGFGQPGFNQGGFNQGGFNQGNQGFNQGSQGFNQGGQGFNQNPQNFNQGFNQGTTGGISGLFNPNQDYQIISALDDDRVIDISQGDNAAKSQAILWEINKKKNQVFRFREVQSGRYQIISQMGTVLSVPGNNPSDGIQIAGSPMTNSPG